MFGSFHGKALFMKRIPNYYILLNSIVNGILKNMLSKVHFQ